MLYILIFLAYCFHLQFVVFSINFKNVGQHNCSNFTNIIVKSQKRLAAILFGNRVNIVLCLIPINLFLLIENYIQTFLFRIIYVFNKKLMRISFQKICCFAEQRNMKN